MPEPKEEKKKTAEQLEQELEDAKKKLAEATKPPKATREDIEEVEPLISPTPPSGGMAQFLSGGTFKMAFVSFLVTILVVTGLGAFGGGSFVTKNDFTKNIQDVVSAMDAVQTNVADKQKSVDDAVAQLPSQVTNAVNQQIGDLKSMVQSSSSQVSDMATQVDNFNTNMSGFSSTLATLTDKINTLEDQIADYEDRIAELEEQSTETPTSDGVARSGDITADIDWDDDWQVGSDNASVICLFRLKVYNDTDEVLEDLWLDFDFNWDGYIDTNFGANHMEVDGKTETTQYNFVFDDVKLRNIDIDPGDHERFYCELTVDVNKADLTWDYVDDNWDIDFDPAVDITDYEFD